MPQSKLPAVVQSLASERTMVGETFELGMIAMTGQTTLQGVMALKRDLMG